MKIVKEFKIKKISADGLIKDFETNIPYEGCGNPFEFEHFKTKEEALKKLKRVIKKANEFEYTNIIIIEVLSISDSETED